MKNTLLALVITFTAFAAQAQMVVTGKPGVTSDYRYRGISQTQTHATLQAGVDFKDKSGFYLGTFNSGVSKELYTGSKGVETDVYGGYKKSFGKVAVDAGIMRYNYWGNDTFDTTEVYLGAEAGPLAVKASRAVTDYFGTANSKGTMYYEMNLSQPVGKINLVAHAGYSDVANNDANNYVDYNVGLTTDIAGLTVGAKWYTNNMKDSYKTVNTVNGKALYKDSFVFTVAKTF